MNKFRKFIIGLAVVVGILVVFAAMAIYQMDYYKYPKVFYEYKEKGKGVQFNMNDVQKGFKK